MVSEDIYCQVSLVKSSWCVGNSCWMDELCGGGGGRIDEELITKNLRWNVFKGTVK
jgi:hypothetical protein